MVFLKRKRGQKSQEVFLKNNTGILDGYGRMKRELHKVSVFLDTFITAPSQTLDSLKNKVEEALVHFKDLQNEILSLLVFYNVLEATQN